MSKIKWKLKNIKTGGVIDLKDSLSQAGRLPSMQIRCNSNLVSRNHANFFILEDGSLRVMDQNTTNGTYINGRRINGKEIIKLKTGDKVALGFDPTTEYEKVANTTFYIFEVLTGDHPVPEIIIDSETDSGTSEKTGSESVKYEEDSINRKILGNIISNKDVNNVVEVENMKDNKVKVKDIENSLKSPEPSTSKYSLTNESVIFSRQTATKEAPQGNKRHLETENCIKETIKVSNKLSDKIIGNNLTEDANLNNETSNKSTSVEYKNNTSEEEHLNNIIEDNRLRKETKLDFKNSQLNIANQDEKLNCSHCIPDTKNKRIEIKHNENICLSLRKGHLQDRELLNKENEKWGEADSESLKFEDNCKSDKENKEKSSTANSLKNTHKNKLSKFKSLKVNVERLTNKKFEIDKNSLTNKETHNSITTEDNIFQVPISVVSKYSHLSTQKNKDSIDDNAVKHVKSRESFFNTQELFSVLTDSKESKESSKFKNLNANVKGLTNNKDEIVQKFLTNNETHNVNPAENNIFQKPTVDSSNCSHLSKRKNEDKVKASMKKIKKDLTEHNTKSISSCKENVSKEIKRSSNLIDNNDSALKGPITRSKSFNENKNETEKGLVKIESVKAISTGFTNEDIIFVEDDDDDDDGSNFPCSQLFQSSQEEEVDNGVVEESNNNDESLFLNIKKELEELDKTDFVPCIMLDSDIESDWYSDGEKNTTAQKVESRRMSDRVVPGTYHNFENNNVDILYYEEAASLNNKSGNEGTLGNEDEHEQNLIIEEQHATLPPSEETMKKIVQVSELESSTVPVSSFYPSRTAKKYIIPPIVEPHRVTRARNCNKRECSRSRYEVGKQEKKRRVEKTPPKYNTTRKDKLAKTTFSNIQKKETKRDEIRKKVKEIAAKKTDQKQKEVTVKKGAVKVKVSEGRGQFLLENNSNLVKNVRKVNINNDLTKPSIKSLHSLKSGATSSKKNSSLPNKINSNTTSSKSLSLREVPRTNRLNVTNKAPLNIPNTLSSVEMNVKTDVSDIINQIIRWSASWLSQQKNKSYSPQVNKRPPVEMSAKFSSYSDYYNIVVPLLLLELWNSLYKDWSNPGNDLRKTTFCSRIEDEEVVKGYTFMKSFTYIDKERHVKGVNIKEEDLVVFEVKSRYDNRKILRTGFGFVTFVCKRPVQEKDVIDFEVASVLGLAPDYCVNFTFKTKSYVNSSDKGNIMFVRLVSSMGPYLRLFKSVKYLQFSPLKEMILNPKIENFKVNEFEPRKLYTDVKLNKSQLKAVVEATELCLGKKPGLYLIQGPPGTGKTTVITSIIQEIVFSADGPPRCALLVAPSNGAVDELVKRLMVIRQRLNDTNRKKFKVIRVGPPNSIHPKVYPFSLEYITKLNFLREVHRIFPEFRDKFLSLQQKIVELERECKITSSSFERLECAKKEYEKICVNNLGRKYFSELDKIRWSCLYNANVICTTLSSCFSLQMEAVFRNSGKITCCIVDEATQSNEQETLIPLMLGLEKIVLVGDPRQLCPTTLSQEAKLLKYGMSLFSRISNQFEDKPDNPIVMLDTQYRMHPEISQLPSKMYYNNRLKNGSRCLDSKFKRLKPYVVFNLAMYCPVEQYRNENEVTFVIKLLSTIIELTSATDSVDIGIITPYNNQKVKLNEALKGYNFRSNVKVTANTVDSFQGQEKDIIIVSYVRMDGNSFVSDEHRLNVALTRAKHALFIVGNKYLFDTCSVLKKIRDNAQRRKLLCIVDDTSSLDLKRIISQ